MENIKINFKEIKKNAGWRERNVLNNLAGFEIIQDDGQYYIIKFYSKDDCFIKYDAISKKIVG